MEAADEHLLAEFAECHVASPPSPPLPRHSRGGWSEEVQHHQAQSSAPCPAKGRQEVRDWRTLGHLVTSRGVQHMVGPLASRGGPGRRGAVKVAE